MAGENMTIAGALARTLSTLAKAGMESSAVVSRDGIMIASDLSMPEEEKETFAAMSAAMLGAAETAVSEMRQGVPRRVIVETGGRQIVAVGAGPKAFLVTVFYGVEPSKAMASIEAAAAEIKGILKTG